MTKEKPNWGAVLLWATLATATLMVFATWAYRNDVGGMKKIVDDFLRVFS